VESGLRESVEEHSMSIDRTADLGIQENIMVSGNENDFFKLGAHVSVNPLEKVF
jgi:hypothetical protein